jgi:C1A family cysteine protease
MPRKIAKYGWRPDLPDHRDYKLTPPVDLAKLPASVDLRPGCPAVYNQGDLGSCTANAIAAAFQFELTKEALPSFNPSRLFIYYNERSMEGTVAEDAGAQIRDGMKSIATLGVCTEDQWPYIEQKFTEKPFDGCYVSALQNKAVQYLRLNQDLGHLKGCLAAGFPFVLGISVFDSFESEEVSKSGMVPLPASGEQCLGGHAVMAVGYDDEKECFLVRNSWGSGWGLEGYFWLPYNYVNDRGLASDFWTLRDVS